MTTIDHAVSVPAERFLPLTIPADFGFTDEHALLQKEARRFCTERSPFDVVRKLCDDEAGFDEGTYENLGELGFLGASLPEAYGGGGLSALHTALVMEEMGRCLLPSPFFASIFAARAIFEAGSDAQRARWLPKIASGETIATLAVSEPDGGYEPTSIHTTAEIDGDDFALHGSKTHVLFGRAANLVVVPAWSPDDTVGLYVLELPTPGATVTADVPIDSTRRTAHLELDSARVPAGAHLSREDVDGEGALRRALTFGTTMLACEMAGALEAVLVMTRDYAIERMQFGRPIGSFQAVKHPIVDIMCQTEIVRTAALAAAAAIDHAPRDAETAAHMAKALASDTFAFAVRKAIQLHGGFGFTWDCNAHFYFKRAMWSRATLGDGAYHRGKLAERILG